MKKIEELKTKINELLDGIEDKATVEKIGGLSTIIDQIEADTTAIENEKMELLKDYKDVIKHMSFPSNGQAEPYRTGEIIMPKIEDFLKINGDK